MAKVGRPKSIQSPEEMWHLFELYRVEVKSNPRYKTQFVGRDGNQVKEPLERPLTHEGFRNFGHANNISVEKYFANTDSAYNEFVTICTRIKETIRQDQIEGGMVGQYNPSITQRLNGLVEKSEQTVKEMPLFPDETTK